MIGPHIALLVAVSAILNPIGHSVSNTYSKAKNTFKSNDVVDGTVESKTEHNIEDKSLKNPDEYVKKIHEETERFKKKMQENIDAKKHINDAKTKKQNDQENIKSKLAYIAKIDEELKLKLSTVEQQLKTLSTIENRISKEKSLEANPDQLEIIIGLPKKAGHKTPTNSTENIPEQGFSKNKILPPNVTVYVMDSTSMNSLFELQKRSDISLNRKEEGLYKLQKEAEKKFAIEYAIYLFEIMLKNNELLANTLTINHMRTLNNLKDLKNPELPMMLNTLVNVGKRIIEDERQNKKDRRTNESSNDELLFGDEIVY